MCRSLFRRNGEEAPQASHSDSEHRSLLTVGHCQALYPKSCSSTSYGILLYLGRGVTRATLYLLTMIRPTTLLFFILLTTVMASATAGESRFQRTTSALQQFPARMSAEFASTALTILTEIYIAEADLARNEAGNAENGAKLMIWAAAVEQYANQLPLMLDDIATGFPVTISETTNSMVGISVAGRFVILSHPRADQQSAYEHRVLGDFCARNHCDQLTPNAESRSPIPVTAPVVNPNWSFTVDGPLCSSGGISIKFVSARQLGNLRGICRQLFQELSSLATEIRWQKAHGVAIDWEIVDIQPTPQRPEHLVILNASGDAILLSLPLLYSSERLIAELNPWLRAKTSGTAPPGLHINAATYGWVAP